MCCESPFISLLLSNLTAWVPSIFYRKRMLKIPKMKVLLWGKYQPMSCFYSIKSCLEEEFFQKSA